MFAAEDAFQDGGHRFNAGSFIVKTDGNPADMRARLSAAASELGVPVFAAAQAPTVNTAKRHIFGDAPRDSAHRSEQTAGG
jgi:hypothetical protein